jgi:phospholipid-binding lipoprotein MlaA
MPASSELLIAISAKGGRFAGGLAFLLAVLTAGCTTPPTDPEAKAAYEEANDPFEPTNRDIFDLNLKLDDNVVKPVAKAYRNVPGDVRKGLHNMIVTVHSPDVFANQVMQGDIDGAADTVLRLVVNLTAGLGGFFDVEASQGGVEAHDTDFGITLAKWGVDEGPYLMLPLFGPSNPRDTAGLVVDNFLDPVGYFATVPESAGRFIFEGIDKREPLIEPLDEIRRTSVDYYATLRSLYRQHRQDQIEGGGGQGAPVPNIVENPGPDSPGDLATAAAGGPAPQGAATPAAAEAPPGQDKPIQQSQVQQ